MRPVPRTARWFVSGRWQAPPTPRHRIGRPPNPRRGVLPLSASNQSSTQRSVRSIDGRPVTRLHLASLGSRSNRDLRQESDVTDGGMLWAESAYPKWRYPRLNTAGSRLVQACRRSSARHVVSLMTSFEAFIRRDPTSKSVGPWLSTRWSKPVRSVPRMRGGCWNGLTRSISLSSELSLHSGSRRTLGIRRRQLVLDQQARIAKPE